MIAGPRSYYIDGDAGRRRADSMLIINMRHYLYYMILDSRNVEERDMRVLHCRKAGDSREYRDW